MSKIDTLVAAIDNAIKTNGTKAITGAILQTVLDNMVGTLTQINGLLNVNQVNNRSDAYASAATARGAVPSDLRAEGLVIAYKLSSGWIIEQNKDISGTWTADSSWQTTGPVGVSHNTSTGNTDITIGSKTTPVPSVNETDKFYSVPFYTIPNTILNYQGGLQNLNKFSTHIFDVIEYAGQTIKITCDGLADAYGDWALLVCEKTDGTKDTIVNNISKSIYNYEYTLPNNAYKLAISTADIFAKKIRLTFGDVLISSSNESKSFYNYIPKQTILPNYRDICDYVQGLYSANGTLTVAGTFRTYKFDISNYIGKKLVIVCSGIPDEYANDWAAFVVENISGTKTVHKDDLIGGAYIGQATGIPYACSSYIPQANDKYLLVSSYTGFISVSANIEDDSNPIIFPVGIEVIRQNFGKNKNKTISQDAITQKIQSVNLLNLEDEDTLIDEYIEYDGSISPFVGIRESGYIPLAPNQILKWTNGDVVTWPYAAVVFYDSNKEYISGISDPSLRGYVVGVENCAYIRISYSNSDKNTLVISYDENVSEYVPYYDLEYLAKKQRVAENNIEDLYDRIGDITGDGSQWNGKSWYAYGTSITNIADEGRYANLLAGMSGLVLTNKGISGGGIGNLGAYSQGQVYAAICNVTDGKLNADLITLETGANDTSADVPLGTIYDTGQSTLAGCLNDCLRYLQAHTNAQIAVMPSPASTTPPTESDKYYEWRKMIREICELNGVYYISPADNLGYARITGDDGSDYVVDNIHQTTLGGYNLAKSMWYQIKNIPLFYTSIPE